GEAAVGRLEIQVGEGDEAVAVQVLQDALAAAARGQVVGLVEGGGEGDVGDLLLVEPDVVDEVRVGQVDAGVDHAQHDLLTAGGQVPRPRRLDVGAGGAGLAADDLAGVLQVPLAAEEGIVGDRAARQVVEVGLDAAAVGHPLQRGAQLVVGRGGRGL